MADSVTKADLDEFRSFLLKELNDHKDQLADQVTGSCNKAESALALSKQLKTDADIKFTHSGNERNFKFNTELREILAIELLESTELNQVKDTLDKALALIGERNRKIRIADTSEAGWLTVKHYEASAVALDPDNDKKMRQAEREALRKKAKASKPRRQYGLPFHSWNKMSRQPYICLWPLLRPVLLQWFLHLESYTKYPFVVQILSILWGIWTLVAGVPCSTRQKQQRQHLFPPPTIRIV